MIYLGNKEKHADEISKIMLSSVPKFSAYYEPFCGTCAVAMKIPGKRFCSDANEHLITFLKAVQQGWRPPNRVFTEQDYKWLKNNSECDPVLYSYLGLYFSFGGKFYDTYRRHRKDGSRSLNEARTSRLALNSFNKYIDRCEDFKGVTFSSKPYVTLNPLEESLIYCDPPYAEVTGYTCGVDHTAFWSWVRNISMYSYVFVSEYIAPPDFKSVFEKQVAARVSSSRRLTNKQSTEKLFVYTKGKLSYLC